MAQDSEEKPDAEIVLKEQEPAFVKLLAEKNSLEISEPQHSEISPAELEFTRPSLNLADRDDSQSKLPVENSSQSVEKIGTIISGKYEILSVLGQGGMSSVYKIRHTLLNKILALKMIHPHLASDKAAIDRFKREAEATSRLEHPNVVNVYDFGVSENGSPFIVMDYIEGISLSQLISKAKGLSPKRAMHIMSQACAALEHAHSRSIVHRDIKPSNIMLINKDGDSDFVKVVDFGIAQLLTEDNTFQRLTQTGQIFGTPLYMSPEQCQGHKLDARTDIYSLGCVMYESITGKAPIEGANVYETIYKQINSLPDGLETAISERQLRVDLETILFTAMAKEPGDRYSSMQEFRKEIDAILTGQKKRSFLSGFINFRRILHHLRPGLNPVNAVLSLVLLSGVAIVAFTTFQGGQQSAGSPQEQWRKQDLTGQEFFDNGELSKSRQQFDQALSIARKFGDNSLVLASLNELRDLNAVSGDKDEKIAAEIEQVSKPDAPVLALQAELKSKLDSINAGENLNEEQRRDLRKFCGDLIDVAMSVSDHGDRDTARAMLLPAKELVAKVFGPEDQLMFRCLHNIALIAHNTGDYAGAIDGYRKALALAEKIFPATDPRIARPCRGLARAYIQIGSNYTETEKLLDRALDINRGSFGPESAQVAVCRFLFASLYFEESRLNEAKREIASAVSIYERAHDLDARELASAYLSYGRINNEPEYYAKALKVLEEMPAKDYSTLCQVLVRLADNLVESAPARAESCLVRAQAICARFYPADRDMTLSTIYQSRAAIYKKEGKAKQAVQALQSALQTAERVYGKSSYKVISILLAVAPVLSENGAFAESESAYKQAFELLKTNDYAKKAMGNAIFLDYVRFLNKQNRKADAEKLAEEWRHIRTVSQ